MLHAPWQNDRMETCLPNQRDLFRKSPAHRQQLTNLGIRQTSLHQCSQSSSLIQPIGWLAGWLGYLVPRSGVNRGLLIRNASFQHHCPQLTKGGRLAAVTLASKLIFGQFSTPVLRNESVSGFPLMK